MKKIILLFSILVFTHISRSQTYLKGGEWFHMDANGNYEVMVENGKTIYLYIDQSSTAIGWSVPNGGGSKYSITCDVAGSWDVVFKPLVSNSVSSRTMVKHYCNIVNYTKGSVTYGQMPDRIGKPVGTSVIIGVPPNFEGYFWTPTASTPTILVTNKGTYSLQTGDWGVPNYFSSDQVEVYDYAPSVKFSITDASSNLLQDATVTMGLLGWTKTVSIGTAGFNNVETGIYSFSVGLAGYKKYYGSINVSNSMVKTVSLESLVNIESGADVVDTQAQPETIEYFDILGRRLSKMPYNIIFIERKTYPNGKVEATRRYLVR